MQNLSLLFSPPFYSQLWPYELELAHFSCNSWNSEFQSSSFYIKIYIQINFCSLYLSGMHRVTRSTCAVPMHHQWTHFVMPIIEHYQSNRTKVSHWYLSVLCTRGDVKLRAQWLIQLWKSLRDQTWSSPRHQPSYETKCWSQRKGNVTPITLWEETLHDECLISSWSCCWKMVETLGGEA